MLPSDRHGISEEREREKLRRTVSIYQKKHGMHWREFTTNTHTHIFLTGLLSFGGSVTALFVFVTCTSNEPAESSTGAGSSGGADDADSCSRVMVWESAG
jgi:hypothetical protein